MAQVLKEEVRNRILEAAEKVFYKKDYRGSKLTEIAKEADIPVALIYTYFKNKEVLFDAVVSSVYINFESAFDEEESLEKGSASERFDEVGENYIHELLKERKKLIILMDKSSGTKHTEAKQIAEHLNVSFDGVRYHIKKLRADGKIKREGSTKSGKWVVTN